MSGLSDEELADIISQLDRYADREFFSYAAWDAGYWSGARVTEFLSVTRRCRRQPGRYRSAAAPASTACSLLQKGGDLTWE